MIKISIITINYNDAGGLEKTLESIRNSDMEFFELIVVDGGSSDNSPEIFKRFEDIITFLISEPDEGKYDAMNKGLKFASGEWCVFVNSGDQILEDFSRKLCWQEWDEGKLYFARAQICDEGKMLDVYPADSIRQSKIDRWLLTRLPNHQATFFPRAFYLTNRYDTSLEISADSDYKLRALKNLDFVFVPETIVKFELGGVSTENTVANLRQQFIDVRNRTSGMNGFWFRSLLFLKLLIKAVLYKLLGTRRTYKFILLLKRIFKF